jgi:hypothetical protein
MAEFPSNPTAVTVIPLLPISMVIRLSNPLFCVEKLEEGECYYAALARSTHSFTACGDVTSGEITLA